MNISNFIAGAPKKGNSYTYFMPETINHTFVWNSPELNMLLEKASLALGELNSFARFVPDIDMFIRMHVIKEAVVSSKIEGTQTEISEALKEELEINPEARNDWQEVSNYINALNFAIAELDKLPLSSRLIKETHKLLLHSVRGERKFPGEFRTSQNWIGGANINSAIFVPPEQLAVSDLMSDLEKFLHNDEIQVAHLIKIAIVHYQFETIHPFLDGNGRIGRLLISLYLVSNSILEKPLLYLSDYFERNRLEYYDRLMEVRQKNNLEQWLIFFLKGVIEISKNSSNTLKEIIIIKEESTRLVFLSLGRRVKVAETLLHYLFRQPIIRVKDVEKECKLGKKAAGDLVDKFVELKILTEMTGYQRNREFVFKSYYHLFDTREQYK